MKFQQLIFRNSGIFRKSGMSVLNINKYENNNAEYLKYIMCNIHVSYIIINKIYRFTNSPLVLSNICWLHILKSILNTVEIFAFPFVSIVQRLNKLFKSIFLPVIGLKYQTETLLQIQFLCYVICWYTVSNSHNIVSDCKSTNYIYNHQVELYITK